MDLQILNPLDEPGWDDLLRNSGDSSFFHTSGWARVLVQSYGYKPVYFVALDGGRLSLLVPYMDIPSLLTGRRGVSLPFSDYCDPYASDNSLIGEVMPATIDYGKRVGWKYVEWRTTMGFLESAIPSEIYMTHNLDLQHTESELLSSFRESNRRNIKKAMKNGVAVTFEQSPESLQAFYMLHCRTRLRHGLPPQPSSFFKNVLDNVIAKGQGMIASAWHSRRIIAATVFFHFDTTAIFKFGASDINSLRYRPNNLILWEAIKWCKARGIRSLSLGRTDVDNYGLLRFKRSWGANENPLNYYRYDINKKIYYHVRKREDYSKRVFSMLPLSAGRFIGRLFYKHVG